MTNAEKFCKLNGIEWHVPDGADGVVMVSNPTFQDAKSILEVMMDRKDYRLFIESNEIGLIYDNEFFIAEYYILNPDKLLTEAIKWCEENPL